MYLSFEQRSIYSPYPPVRIPDVQVVHEKGSGEDNEDLFLYEDGLYGVFDGATSLSKRRYSLGRTGGFIAAELAAETFRKNLSDLCSGVVEANNRIRMAQDQERGFGGERNSLWSASLAVVQISGERLEYCSLGDTAILVLTGDGDYQLVTPEMDIDQETLSMWKAYRGEEYSIYKVLSEQISKVRNRMNIDYGVLNGEAEALDFVESGSISLADVTDVLLLTDGLLIPRENPKEAHDWDCFVKLYRSGGLREVWDYVRDLQRQDPDNRRYPRFKTHDDIAAIAVSF